MKKLLYLLLLVVAVLGLAACKGRSAYKKCVKHLEGHLKDPDSLKVEGATGYKSEDGVIVFKIQYRAKNSWGAYNGSETMCFIIENGNVECDHCTVLSGHCSVMYTLISISGEEIFSK